jgi:two-component sensor histidine kinase
MDFDAAYRRARSAVVDAVLGSAGDSRGGLKLPARFAVTLVAVMAATVIWALVRAAGVLGAASFYFPAILVVTFLAGWEFGLGALAASAALIWAVARVHPPMRSLLVFFVAGLLQIFLAAFIRTLLRQSWRAERTLAELARTQEREAESRELVLGEARHRLKNLMAIIEALAKFSAPRAGVEPALDGFLKRFVGRLRALGAASDLVLKFGPGVLETRAVVSTVLEPFLSESPARLNFDGPELELSEHFGGALAMAVHELATNALKYGALSVPQGSVNFVWSVTDGHDGERIVFLWEESGGPPPRPPQKEGYGHRMIRSVAQRETHGEVRIEYPPQGLVCRIAYLRRRRSAAA